MSTRKRRATKNVDDFLIDFSKEDTSGAGGDRVPAGYYTVTIKAAKPTKSKDKGTAGLEVTCVVDDGKFKGKKIVDTLYASPKAFRRFRTLLEAVGADVPERVVLGDIAEDVEGETLVIETEVERRKGYSPRTRITFDGFFPEGTDFGDEDEDEDEDDFDIEDDEDDFDDDEEEDDEEEDEPEPEPAPRRRRRTSKPEPAPKSRARRRRKPADDDDDLDLDDL